MNKGQLINQNPPINGDEISLKEVFLKLRKLCFYFQSKWKVIILVSSLGSLLGFIYSINKPALFEAELTFVLEDTNSSSMGNYASIAGQFGVNLGGNNGGDLFSGENLIALMQSRSMIDRAFLTVVTFNGQKQTLAEVYIKINKLRDNWAKENSKLQTVQFLPKEDPSRFSVMKNGLLESFYNNILVENLIVDKKDKTSTFISVQVKSNNELFSKYFAETLVKEVAEFYIESKTKKSMVNLTILQHQTDSVNRALNAAIRRVAVSNDAISNLNPSRQVLRVNSQQIQFDAQLNQTILSQLIPSLELAKIAVRNETPLIQVIDKPILPLKVVRVSKIKYAMIGTFSFGFLIMIWLLIIRFVKEIMA